MNFCVFYSVSAVISVQVLIHAEINKNLAFRVMSVRNLRQFYSCFVLLSLITFCSSDNCNLQANLKQELSSDGFHRNLTYFITMKSVTSGGNALTLNGCTVGLDQELPPGLYANPDELGDLKRAHKAQIIPKNRVNVELPTEQSSESYVFIIGNIQNQQSSVWLPVHARYHKAAAGGGYASNTIKAPKMYVRCPNQRLNNCDDLQTKTTFLCNASSRERCEWISLPTTVLSKPQIWRVPIGNTDHYYTVAGGTAFVIVLGSIYILQALHEYKTKNKIKSP